VVPTLNNRDMCPARICKENGWGPGTRLVGDEGNGPTVIEITAIGEHSILAKQISQNGAKYLGTEGLWCLDCREWKVVKSRKSGSKNDK